MEALGIKKHQTYIKAFNDLVKWGFINLIQKSKNQYSANIISIKNAIPKNGKALDKAFIKHGAKQMEGIGQSTGQSTGQSKVHIVKPINKEPINKEQGTKDLDFPSWLSVDVWESFVDMRKSIKKPMTDRAIKMIWKKLEKFGIDLHEKILERSIVNNWQDVFPLQKNKSKSWDDKPAPSWITDHTPGITMGDLNI